MCLSYIHNFLVSFYSSKVISKSLRLLFILKEKDTTGVLVYNATAQRAERLESWELKDQSEVLTQKSQK